MTTPTKKRILSGIKPTGTPHIGNYAGMLLPMLQLAANHADQDVFMFVADYHALNNADARKNLGPLGRELTATLLALGFDPKTCTFYRQSDVPEVFELASFLTNFTPKGLMNRAHAYKGEVGPLIDQIIRSADEFKKQHHGHNFKEIYSPTGYLKRVEIVGSDTFIEFVDPDIGVNMGLYNYPILMAADILLYDIDCVPVGRDQRQHIEIARDIAGYVNNAYGQELLKLPEGVYQADTQEVPGIDGRKMSKSYGNVLPIFAEAAEVEKIVKKIKTDSTLPAEPKDKDNLLVKFHQAMSTPEQHADFLARFLPGGMGYGDAKKEVMAAHEAKFGKARDEYKRLMAAPGELDSILKMGAEKARDVAGPVLRRIRKAAGFSA